MRLRNCIFISVIVLDWTCPKTASSPKKVAIPSEQDPYIRRVAQASIRTCGVKYGIWSVKGICLHAQQLQIWNLNKKCQKKVRNLFWATVLFKYHDLEGVFFLARKNLHSLGACKIIIFQGVFLRGFKVGPWVESLGISEIF